jgi:hypothetical protein
VSAKEPTSGCPKCGLRRAAEPVHGQTTCHRCGADITTACAGADPVSEAAPHAGHDFAVPTDLFPRLFVRLAKKDASVTTEALLFAICEHQDVDLEGARLLLEAGEHTRAIARTGPDSWRLRRRRRRRP